MISNFIKKSKRLKALTHWLITPDNNPRPRLWVRLFLTPILSKRGKGSKIRHARMDIFPWNKFTLGKLATIEDFAVVANGVGDVFIGDYVRIGIGSTVLGPATLCSGAGLGQHVFISGFNHGYSDGNINSKYQPLVKKPVYIGEDSHIGANSVVVAGVRIGKRCQIGAGSVVTKDIPDYSVAVGNPARVIKQYNFTTNKWERV